MLLAMMVFALKGYQLCGKQALSSSEEDKPLTEQKAVGQLVPLKGVREKGKTRHRAARKRRFGRKLHTSP